MNKNVDIEDFDRVHEQDLLKLQKDFAIEITDAIIDNAPVDTGKLRGSVKVDRYGDPRINHVDPSGNISKIDNRTNVMSIELGDDLYITIGESYAKYIDEGTVHIPPTGFYSRVFNNLDSILKKLENEIV